MYKPIQRTITTPSERTLLSRSPMPIAIALARLALLPTTQAVSPPPDGGYGALLGNTTGSQNTAVAALGRTTTGINNTANGFHALLHNTAGGTDYTFTTFTFTYQNIQRIYGVHIPNSYSPNHKTPVVMYLHGAGSSLTEASQITKYSDTYGFILLAPQGTGSGGKYAWNAGGIGSPNIDDVGYIAQVITRIEQQYNIDPRHIYATGFSNGAAMTNRLGCELSNIAAIAPASGQFSVTCNDLVHAIPVMQINGTGDACNPYSGGLATHAQCIIIPIGTTLPFNSASSINARWIALDQCSAATTIGYRNGAATCVVNPSCAGSAQVNFCTVIGMGHVYPDGVQYLPVSLIGPVSHDISFDRIWAFFKQFSLP
jgi:polyhydroxybutyrate depolymerase